MGNQAKGAGEMKKWNLLVCFILMLSLCVTACGTDKTAEETSPAAVGETTAAEKSVEPEGGLDASGDPQIKLSFGGTAAADDLITKGMEMVAELAAERSGGTIVINVFPASQLGDAVAQLESMIGGGQDMMIEAQGSYMQQYGVADAAVNSFGLVATQEALAKELDSEMWSAFETQFKDTNNIDTLANNWIRQPTVIACKKPLKTIEDFKGVKLRVVPSATTTAVYEALGFSPTPVAYSETYLSLSQGVIDGTIASYDAMYTMKFYEVAPNITKYGNSCTNVAIWINGNKFASMTQAQQQILRDACEEAGEWYTQASNDMMSEYEEKMVAGGATIIDVDDSFVQKANDILSAVAYDFEKEGKMREGIYDELAELVK